MQGRDKCECDSVKAEGIRVRFVQSDRHTAQKCVSRTTLQEEIEKLESEIDGISRFVCKVVEYLMKKA